MTAATMKAVVYTEYGPPEVLHLTEMETPAPAAGEILVRVRANSINYGDLIARNFRAVGPRTFNMPGPLWLPTRLVFGWRKPRNPILGSEFAGEVAAVGAEVTRFQPGDRVFGYRSASMGANVEYLTVGEASMVAPMPAGMSYADAAVLPYGALTALNLLKRVTIEPGTTVLINGASGGIGSAAVQLARHYGAEVTGVAGTRRQDYVRALGADHVIDYSREDFTRGDATYDIVFDILGKSTFNRVKRVLTPKGRYLRASFKMREVFQALWTSLRGSGKRVIVALSSETLDDLETVRALAESGVLTPVIDRTFPLAQTAAAHRYVESGSRQGRVAITLD
jgi:NADPH:quinone reductase-like Zn-dependent oxidoreductase